MTRTQTSTIIRPGVGLLIARGVWLLFAAATFTVFFTSLDQFTGARPWVECPTRDSGCQLNAMTQADLALAAEAGLSPEMFGLLVGVTSIVARLSVALVAVVIFVLRSNERIAWVMSLAMLTVLAEGVTDMGRLQLLVDAIFAVGVLVWLPIPFIFPNGRVEPRWLKWPVVVLTVLIAPVWTPAVMVRLPPIGLTLLTIGTSVWAVLGAFSLIYRYRRVSTPVERQQVKWVVGGLLAVFVTSATYSYLQLLFPPWEPSPARITALLVNGVGYIVGYGLLSTSLAFAILRYRLWEVDLVIRRTLLYGVLTVMLALIYWGAVVVLQSIFAGLTGNSSLAIIGSTLLIAALFQPLRRRVQQVIDRRFFRRKYDATQALAGFAATARDDLDLNGLTTGLLTVVDDTMQPTTAGVWLRPAGEAPPPARR